MDGTCARWSPSWASALAGSSGRCCPAWRGLPGRPSLGFRGLSWGALRLTGGVTWVGAYRPARGRVLVLLGRGGEWEVLDRLLGGCGRVRARGLSGVASPSRVNANPARE